MISRNFWYARHDFPPPGDKLLIVPDDKNIHPGWGGYGKALIDFLVRKYAGHYALLQVGTGDSPLTVPFYEKCGFTRSHRIPNFFTDRYDHPIYEAGVQLVDMVYLQRNL